MKADSLDLLQQAKALKNETSNDLKTRLDNSLSALAALEDQNLDIEQKYTETQFNIGSLRTSMSYSRIHIALVVQSYN